MKRTHSVTGLFACIAFLLVSFSLQKDENRNISKYQELQQNICKGWNTWNTNSILSYVHLPEAFAINLAVKNYGNEQDKLPFVAN